MRMRAKCCQSKGWWSGHATENCNFLAFQHRNINVSWNEVGSILQVIFVCSVLILSCLFSHETYSHTINTEVFTAPKFVSMHTLFLSLVCVLGQISALHIAQCTAQLILQAYSPLHSFKKPKFWSWRGEGPGCYLEECQTVLEEKNIRKMG